MDKKDEFDSWDEDTVAEASVAEVIDKKEPVKAEKVPEVEEPKKKSVEKKPEPEVEGTPSLARRPQIGKNVKILLYGTAGTGKTRTAMLHFKKLWEQDKSCRCKYFDTDKGLTEVLKEKAKDNSRLFPSELVDNIDVYDCGNLDATVAALGEVMTTTTDKDIVVFDMIDKLYEDAQEKYTQAVFGEDLAEYVIYKRRELAKKGGAAEKKGAFEGWTDWVAIKMLHNRGVIDRITKQIGCHVICVTSAKAVDMNNIKEGKIVENPTIFTKVGFSPAGEKRNPHRFDRVYYFGIGVDNYYYTAVKKRGGKTYVRIPVNIGDNPEL